MRLSIEIFVQTLAVDLLNPSAKAEERRHKLKRLVQSPNSYFMDVKCSGMFARSPPPLLSSYKFTH